MKTGNDKKGTPPYSIGWLGLIPLVGGFVGIALVLNGIFKYKDRKLIVIGVVDILITVSVYSLLFFDMKYGEDAGRSFAELSELQLTTLMKQIEFYKSQKGDYPESLEKLRKSDPTVMIVDPVISRKMDDRLNTHFHYERIGNRYTLFSAGIDGIPNTKDDIYPSIAGIDTSKIGLIRKQ